jgi:hypothetical protein
MGIIRPVCVFLICEYLREMNFFLSRRSTLILFSLIYADFIRNHLYEYYAALQLRIVLLHFFCYKYYRFYAAQSGNCLLKYSPIEFYRHIISGGSTVLFVVRNGNYTPHLRFFNLRISAWNEFFSFSQINADSFLADLRRFYSESSAWILRCAAESEKWGNIITLALLG